MNRRSAVQLIASIPLFAAIKAKPEETFTATWEPDNPISVQYLYIHLGPNGVLVTGSGYEDINQIFGEGCPSIIELSPPFFKAFKPGEVVDIQINGKEVPIRL